MSKVTAKTITLGQMHSLFLTSRDPDVVRAAVIALIGAARGSFLANPTDYEQDQAHETLAKAWNEAAA